MTGLEPARTWGRVACALCVLIATATASADAVADAERLWRVALAGKLTDAQAKTAAGMFDHKDPIVRALAEWAIATKVGLENNGQELVWPGREPPAWFRRWSNLDARFLLDADYARTAIVWGIHTDGLKLLRSADKIVQRARAAAPAARETVKAQLDRLTKRHARLAYYVESRPASITTHRQMYLAVRRAARPIVLANRAANFGSLLFVRRHSAHTHRNITGSQYPWVHKPGGDICVWRGPMMVSRVLRGRLGPGHVHGIDLSSSADRIVFGYARQPRWPPKWDTISGDNVFKLRGDQEPTHIYEIPLPDGPTRQVTRDPYWSDFEPTYLADGTIVFASDRCGRSSECGKFSADHTVVNLYAVKPPQRHPRRLSDNKDIDRYPHSLANGQLAYTRWEYQERHFLEVHSVWTIRPDGTKADAAFNQHMRAPYGLRDTRSIPGSDKLVSIATGHHTFAYGPVVVLDPSKGINDPSAITIVTPRAAPQEGPMAGRPVPSGGPPDSGGLYQTPWALSERCFLVSYSYARPRPSAARGTNAHGFAIYFIDSHGNKELIHRDLLYSCVFPIPLRRRPRPPVLTDTTRPADTAATCYVGDVHYGLPAAVGGKVKYIRISQRVGWPLDADVGAMRYIPGNAWQRRFGFWAWAPVRVIGTVPVEPDGSAHFKVPVDTAVYFQALDANHMEIRRMRSHVTFQPGEVRGCVGCHESKLASPPGTWGVSQALRRPPRTPQAPAWGSRRLLGYDWMIQPIFESHCTRCHGGTKPKAGLDFTGKPAADGFRRSFHTLFPGKKRGNRGMPLVSVSDRLSGSGVTAAMAFGSHRSRLILTLLKPPRAMQDVKLGRQEWLRLVTWVDANAPYHDTFYDRRPTPPGPPRRDVRFLLPAPFAARSATQAPRFSLLNVPHRIQSSQTARRRSRARSLGTSRLVRSLVADGSH